MSLVRPFRADLLLITQNPQLLEGFRQACALLPRPARLHHYASLGEPGALDLREPWHLVCLDVQNLQYHLGEAWTQLLRRWVRERPETKWVLAVQQYSPSVQRLRGYVHYLLLPPWEPEPLARQLRTWLFPDPAFPGLLDPRVPLPPQPQSLPLMEIGPRLRELLSQFPLQGTGLLESASRPLLWEGEPWPHHLSLPAPRHGAAQFLGWTHQEQQPRWFAALPVFQNTWLAAWGTETFPYAALMEALAALRDALQHLEPEPLQEPSAEDDLPPDAAKPLFEDVPPPFPDFPFPPGRTG